MSATRNAVQGRARCEWQFDNRPGALSASVYCVLVYAGLAKSCMFVYCSQQFRPCTTAENADLHCLAGQAVVPITNSAMAYDFAKAKRQSACMGLACITNPICRLKRLFNFCPLNVMAPVLRMALHAA